MTEYHDRYGDWKFYISCATSAGFVISSWLLRGGGIYFSPLQPIESKTSFWQVELFSSYLLKCKLEVLIVYWV
jgi:hypothetical protein